MFEGLKAIRKEINSAKMENIDNEEIKDGYQIRFIGKNYAKFTASLPTETVLVPDTEWNGQENNKNSQNIFITGDNLDALKHLINAYSEQIKMIYIDPPYNTGSDDFVYKDNFNFTDKELQEKLELTEKEVTRIRALHGKCSHSAWLTFMLPRLLLAKQLLAKDGVIFISIDDNEEADLRLLCDEMFGENNRVETFNIQVRYANKSLNEKDDFQKLMEYVLIYAKNKELFRPKKPIVAYDVTKFNLNIKELNAPDKTETINGKRVDIFLPHSYVIETVKPAETETYQYFKETWVTGSIYSGTGHGKTYQKIVEPRLAVDGYGVLYKIYGLGEDGLGYRYMTGPKQAKSKKGKMYNKIPLNKLTELQQGISKKSNPIINFYDYSADFGNIRHEGGIPFNSGKKPIKMLKEFIKIANLQNNDIVMDFFAGSASTAHAVMKLNADEKRNYRWILAQLDEPTWELDNKGNKVGKAKHSELFKSGFESIDQISRQRIKNATNELNDKSGFKHFKLAKVADDVILDKIDNFDPTNDEMFSDDMLTPFSGESLNTDLKATGVDTLLATWLVDDGFPLTTPIHEVKFANYTAYSPENSNLLYLVNMGWDSDATKELLNKLGKNELVVQRLIIYNHSFDFVSLTELKTNIHSVLDTDMELIERF